MMIPRLPADMLNMAFTYLSPVDINQLYGVSPRLDPLLSKIIWKSVHVHPRSRLRYYYDVSSSLDFENGDIHLIASNRSVPNTPQLWNQFSPLIKNLRIDTLEDLDASFLKLRCLHYNVSQDVRNHSISLTKLAQLSPNVRSLILQYDDSNAVDANADQVLASGLRHFSKVESLVLKTDAFIPAFAALPIESVKSLSLQTVNQNSTRMESLLNRCDKVQALLVVTNSIEDSTLGKIGSHCKSAKRVSLVDTQFMCQEEKSRFSLGSLRDMVQGCRELSTLELFCELDESLFGRADLSIAFSRLDRLVFEFRDAGMVDKCGVWAGMMAEKCPGLRVEWTMCPFVQAVV